MPWLPDGSQRRDQSPKPYPLGLFRLSPASRKLVAAALVHLSVVGGVTKTKPAGEPSGLFVVLANLIVLCKPYYLFACLLSILSALNKREEGSVNVDSLVGCTLFVDDIAVVRFTAPEVMVKVTAVVGKYTVVAVKIHDEGHGTQRAYRRDQLSKLPAPMKC
ncbi:hypothetical protein [Comamonas sp. C24C]